MVGWFENLYIQLFTVPISLKKKNHLAQED
jgi:hypothetical protein